MILRQTGNKLITRIIARSQNSPAAASSAGFAKLREMKPSQMAAITAAKAIERRTRTEVTSAGGA
jgi:hypothetical protein